MIALLATLFMIAGMGLLISGSWWAVLCFLLGGVAYMLGDSIDDDIAILGGCFIWIFFGVCTYVIFKQAVIWLTDLVLMLVSL